MATTPGLLLASVLAASLALACLARVGAVRSGFCLALLILGQASTLHLTEAGPRVSYQHLLPPGRMWHDAPVALAALVLQLVIAVTGMWQQRARLLRAVPEPRTRWGVLACGLILAMGSATVSRNASGYGVELALATLIQLSALGVLVLALLELPEALSGRFAASLRELLGDASKPETAAPHRIDRYALALAAWVLVVAVLLNRLAYQGHPHVPDEVAYLLHAKYFARGMLTMPAPPVPAAFDVDLMTYEPGRWYSPVPPGWPAVLAVGALLGAPWLVNPVLAALNVLLSYLVLLELYDRRTARTALLFLAVSPWHLFMAMNYMNHTLTFTAALVAALGVARNRRGAGLAWPLGAGAGAGLVSLIRPLEGMIVAGLCGLWALAPRDRRWDLRPAIAFGIGTLVVGGAVFPYNKALTGNPLVFPIMQYTDSHYGVGTNALGFGPNRGLGWGGLDPFPGHGAIDVVVNANLNGTATNVELLGWATGSLLPLAILLFLLPLRRGDRFMLAMIMGVIGVHCFYWFSGGPDFGARYWYLILLPCLALAASAVTTMDTLPRVTGRATMGAIALSLSALVTFVPWRAVDKYYHYRGMRPDIRRLAEHDGFGTSLVLVRGNRHPDYHSAAIYNPIDLNAPQPIYAWDRDSTTRAAVLRAYPGRPVWLVDGPSLTGDGYTVVAGPLPEPPAP